MTPPHDDPIARARLAAAWATDGCARTGCGWYHGTWPLWRALGLASAPDVHEVFYREALLDHLDAGGGDRVLVTGAADPEMLATTLRAFRARGRTPRLEALDRCATPLALAAAWAHHEGVPLRTHQVDALVHATDARFDLVLTHAFLGYFDPAGRAALAARWRDWLAPDGRLITLNRLRPDAPDARVGFTAAQAAAFVARARTEAEGRWDVDDAVARAEVWTRNLDAWPLRDADTLRALLEGAGLSATLHTIPPAPGAPPAGPGSPGQATYVGVVARRS